MKKRTKVQKKDGNFLTENYKKCWKFAGEFRWFFVFTLGVFMTTFLVGFAFPVFFRAEIIEMIRELILQFEGLGTGGMILKIFFNNLMVSFFAFVLGIMFGIFPLITLVFNGYLIGFVAHEVTRAEGIFVLWRLLPHGIFELPAVLFSIAIGLKLGWSVVASGKNNDTHYVFVEGVRFFCFVIFPLLLVAGLIEGVLIGLSA